MLQSNPALPHTTQEPEPAVRRGAGGQRGAFGRALKWRTPSYRSILIFWFSALVVLTGVSVTLLAFSRARAATEQLAGSVFREATGRATSQTRQFVLRAPAVARTLTSIAGTTLTTADQQELGLRLAAVLEANPGFGWVSFGDEQGAFSGAYRTREGGIRLNLTRISDDGRTHMFEYDVAPDGALTPYRSDDDFGYDPRVRPFYAAAKAAGHGVWTPPYLFYDPHVPGITYAEPVFGDGGALRGVLTVDFHLRLLSELTEQLEFSDNARLVILAPGGEVLAHPTATLTHADPGAGDERIATVHDLQDPVAAAFFAQLTPADFAAPEGGEASRQFKFQVDGRDYFGTSTAVTLGPGLTWCVGAMAPRSDFMAEVHRSERAALALAAGCVVGAVLLGAILARRVSGPVVSLVGFMRRVGDGKLDERANFGATAEFRRLSAELNQMIGRLRDAVRLRTSLALANEVQQGLLPQRPPTVLGLDVVGHSTYCDETGGDYYDYLVAPQSPGRLTVVCGDVMGHGVAAALLMAGVRGILRSNAADLAAPGGLGRMLELLNAHMLADTGGRRFMTLCLIELDGRTCAARWACAGHDPAMVYDPADGTFFELDGGGLPLGVMGDTSYAEFSRPLRAGQVVLIGTDGVWDSENADREPFGKDRLRDALRAAAQTAKSAPEIEAHLRRRLAEFTGGQRSRDDVTFVVLRIGCDPAA